MKVAICSSDGANIDLHFGKTTAFYIYNFIDGKKKVIDKRNVQKYSPIGVEVLECTNRHPFDKDRFELVYETIQDCDMIFTTSIGDVPKQKLIEKGIEVQECMCAIDWIPTHIEKQKSVKN